MWTRLIALIKSIDYEGQEKLLNDCWMVMKTSTLDLNTERHRTLAMTVLLKCANMAPFARPFGLLLKWQNAMMNEMFWLGDQERKLTLDYSSRHNSRDHHNKEQCQIALIGNYAIPLFDVQAAMFPGLKGFLSAAQDNLSKWKARLS
jgi:hypothetical protein